MERYLEKSNKRYVIATLDNPTQYLISQNDNICFTTDISKCTKLMNRSLATYVRDDFYNKTKWHDYELVILPLVISYEIINEFEDVIER